jgi:uncharacterized paraquat-inducible protein A
MYCPSCGKEVNPSLSYCNYCGVRLSAKDDENPYALATSSFNLLLGAVVAIPVLGVGLIIALMAAMKNGLNFRDEMIGIVVLMSFLLLLVAETGCLLMLITRTRKPKAKASKDPAAFENRAVKAIEDSVIRELNPSSFQGIPSVTEHTTRTLDAAYRKTDDRD